MSVQCRQNIGRANAPFSPHQIGNQFFGTAFGCLIRKNGDGPLNLG